MYYTRLSNRADDVEDLLFSVQVLSEGSKFPRPPPYCRSEFGILVDINLYSE
jgi:hypothetical protein